LAASDYTATSGTSVVLVNAASAGDTITTESFYVSSVLNALPTTGGSISGQLTVNSATGQKPLIAQVNGTQVFEVDSAGKTLIGLSSSISSWGSAAGQQLQVTASGARYPGISSYAFSNTAAGDGAMINLGRSRSATVGTLTTTQSGDALGYLIFEGVNSSSALTGGGYISVNQTAAAGASYIPAAMLFYTSDATNGAAEKMRISSAGYVTTPYQPRLSCLVAGTNGTALGGYYAIGSATPDINVGSCFNTTTRVFTCPVAGIYRISVSASNNDGQAHYLASVKNGAAITGFTLFYTAYTSGAQSVLVSCAAGDTLGALSRFNSGLYSAQLAIELVG
jgi:hypothetical protein